MSRSSPPAASGTMGLNAQSGRPRLPFEPSREVRALPVFDVDRVAARLNRHHLHVPALSSQFSDKWHLQGVTAGGPAANLRRSRNEPAAFVAFYETYSRPLLAY